MARDSDGIISDVWAENLTIHAFTEFGANGISDGWGPQYAAPGGLVPTREQMNQALRTPYALGKENPDPRELCTGNVFCLSFHSFDLTF